MQTELAIHSLLRIGTGLLLLGAALSALWVARTIDWGVAWVVVIPALALLPPACGLLGRRHLRLHDGRLQIESGWLWRRVWELPLDGCRLELLPTAGARAVLLHRSGREYPVATWLRPSRAAAVAAWLDQAAPAGAWPRQERSAHHLDR